MFSALLKTSRNRNILLTRVFFMRQLHCVQRGRTNLPETLIYYRLVERKKSWFREWAHFLLFSCRGWLGSNLKIRQFNELMNLMSRWTINCFFLFIYPKRFLLFCIRKQVTLRNVCAVLFLTHCVVRIG